MTTKIAPLMTVEDLEAMPDDGNRYELIEGELFIGEPIMTRSPTLAHQFAIGNLHSCLKDYLKQNPLGKVVFTPGVIFDEYNSFIPDLAFLTNEQLARIGSESHIREAPALVIEVVSPGSDNARRDRVIKLQIYGKFSVGEYWIADPEARTVEIYRQTDGALELAASLGVGEETTSSLLPGFRCGLDEVFGG
jgi:Uma2 family endonuclease